MQAVPPGSDDEELFSKFQKYIGKRTDEVEESLTEPFNRVGDIEKTVSQIYQTTRELNQQLAGSRKYVEQIGINFTDAGNKILNFADNVKTLEDAIALVGKVAGDIQEKTGRAYIATSEELKGIIAAQGASGVLAEDLVKSFKDQAFALSQVPKVIQKVIDTSAALGVNSVAVTKSVLANLDKLNTFNFANGVEGLTRMAAQATMLGIDMGKTLAKAEELLDPERAIDMAASLQRLGVATGDLIDPLRLMDLGQNNPKELQNQIVEMSKRFTYFNEQNQKFEILPGAKRELREIAGAVGLTADELAKMSLKSSELADKMGKIRFPSLDMPITEDQKTLIANMAEMRDGEYKIQVKETVVDKETGELEYTGRVLDKAVSKLDPEDLKSLMKQQEDGSKSLEEIARDNLSEAQKMNRTLEQQLSTMRGGAATSRLTNKTMEAVNGVLSDFQSAMGEVFKTEQFREASNEILPIMRNVYDGFTAAFKDNKIDQSESDLLIDYLKKSDDKLGEIFGSNFKAFEKLKMVLEKSPEKFKDALDFATKPLESKAPTTGQMSNQSVLDDEGKNLMQRILDRQNMAQNNTQNPNIGENNRTNSTIEQLLSDVRNTGNLATNQTTNNQTTNLNTQNTNINTSNFYEQVFNQITQTIPTALQGIKLPEINLDLDPLKTTQEGQLKLAEQSLSELQKINNNLLTDNKTLMGGLDKIGTPKSQTSETANVTNVATTTNDNSVINNSEVINNRQEINNRTENLTNVTPPTPSFDLSPLTLMQEKLLSSNDNSLSELKSINNNLKMDNESLMSFLSKNPVPTPNLQNTNITNTNQKTENLTNENSFVTNNDNRQTITNDNRKINEETSFDYGKVEEIFRKPETMFDDMNKNLTQNYSDFQNGMSALNSSNQKTQSLIEKLNEKEIDLKPAKLEINNIENPLRQNSVEYKAPIVQTPEIPVAMNNMFNSVTEKMVETRVNSSSDVKYDGRLSIDINVNAPNGVDKNTVAETIQKMLYDDKVRKNIEESVIGGRVGNYNPTTGIPV